MGMYVEAVIDSETGELVRGAPFRVLQENGVDEAIVFDRDSATGNYSPLSQPISSDSMGNLRFWASPGLYNLTRGTTPTLIEVFGQAPFPDEVTIQPLTNQSGAFEPLEYSGVTFHRAYMPQTVLGGDTTISGPFPEPSMYFYRGSGDITVTFDTELCIPGSEFIFYQLGTGAIEFAWTGGTISNFYGHTKTAGPKAVALITQTGDDVSGLEFVLTGLTE